MSSAMSLPFGFDANGAVNSTADQKKIIQDRVVLVLLTLISERVMRPSFGTRIKSSSFENVNDALILIRQEAAVGFSNWLPYLSLLSVNGSIDPNDGHLNIVVNYQYGTSTTAETVVVKTDILSRAGEVITEVISG